MGVRCGGGGVGVVGGGGSGVLSVSVMEGTSGCHQLQPSSFVLLSRDLGSLLSGNI